MDLPTIHCCNMLTLENETLSKKYQKLTRKYKTLERQFLDLKQKLTEEKLKRDIFDALESLEINAGQDIQNKFQPNTQLAHHGNMKNGNGKGKQISKIQAKETPSKVKETNSKLLSMHNELIKKFEREIKLNTRRLEQITRLSLEKNDLQQRLTAREQEIADIRRQHEAKEKQIKTQDTSSRLTPKASELKRKLVSVTTEKNRLEVENIKLKEELKGLDQGFFEEVEDLKYALHKSARLNMEYEKALKNLCKKYDIDYSTLKIAKGKSPKRRTSKQHKLLL